MLASSAASSQKVSRNIFPFAGSTYIAIVFCCTDLRAPGRVLAIQEVWYGRVGGLRLTLLKTPVETLLTSSETTAMPTRTVAGRLIRLRPSIQLQVTPSEETERVISSLMR